LIWALLFTSTFLCLGWQYDSSRKNCIEVRGIDAHRSTDLALK